LRTRSYAYIHVQYVYMSRGADCRAGEPTRQDVIDDAAGLVAEHGYAGLLSRLSAVLLLRSSTGTSRRGSS